MYVRVLASDDLLDYRLVIFFSDNNLYISKNLDMLLPIDIEINVKIDVIRQINIFLVQLLWLLIITALGYILLNKNLKKVVVQGG